MLAVRGWPGEADRLQAGTSVIGRRYGWLVSATAKDARRATSRSVAAHHPLGVSTGMFVDHRDDWPGLVATACEISTYAVELSALSGRELPGLVEYLQGRPRLPFRYVSVHAPVKDLDEQDYALLAELPVWLRSFVVHPETLSAAAPYRSLGTRLVLENMDDRKTTGRTPNELAELFAELPEAGLCLDVAHAHSLDPSMALAHELLDCFRSRLRHVHVSSLDAARHHVPLTEEDENLFSDVLDRCRDVPWILEAPPPQRWTRELKETNLVANVSLGGSDQM